jgi:5'-AMP-activated protein kinase catalytic alpha subunit
MGTFGKVRKAVHILTGEKVAVKIFEKNRIKDKGKINKFTYLDDLNRITREIKIHKRIKHPNVAQFYEIVETDDEIYLIMEYSNGGELFDYIVSKQRLKEVEACRIYQELLSGIEYLNKNFV